MYSVFRRQTHAALAGHKFTGEILDLGGEHASEYHQFLEGDFTVKTVNLDTIKDTDIVADLEEPIPVADASYDGALLINVLEHIYHVQQLVQETYRVVRSGAPVVAVVPFLYPIHPSPHDFYRFTDRALERMFTEAGFSQVTITPIGGGVFMTRHLFIGRLLPGFLSAIVEYPLTWCAKVCDALFTGFAKITGKSYRGDTYPMGYLVSAKK